MITASPQRSTTPTEAASYVYGIVRATAQEPREAAPVADPAGHVMLIRHGSVAALVSDLPTDGALGSPDDLRAHARLLDTLAAQRVAVLPLRFGSVLQNPSAVTDELLTPHADLFAAALDKLADCAQFTVRGQYRQDRILRDLLRSRPDLAALREEVNSLPEDAGYYQRIRLGESIAQAMDGIRRADGQELVERLSPLAVDVAAADPGRPEDAVDASFLVRHPNWHAFEAAAESAARNWADRIQLRLLGPLAPYDFVTDVIDAIEGAP